MLKNTTEQSLKRKWTGPIHKSENSFSAKMG